MADAELRSWCWWVRVFHGLVRRWVGPAGRAADLDSFGNVVECLLTYGVGRALAPSGLKVNLEHSGHICLDDRHDAKVRWWCVHVSFV